MNGNKGFSLTEVSIVLVIIALLITAVMKGQNLIAEARLQAIAAEVSQYKVAINSFYAKYDQYPGDFDNAVANWGATTENGDDNGHIEFQNSDDIYEGYRAWQHLAYSQMVTSPYPGTQTTSAAVAGTDVPTSKTNGAYMLDYNVYGLSQKNVLVLGVPAATSASPILASGLLTPVEAMALDAKIDDGVPTKGTVRGSDGNLAVAESCVDMDVSGTEDIYKISATGKDCIMAFKVAGQ